MHNTIVSPPLDHIDIYTFCGIAVAVAYFSVPAVPFLRIAIKPINQLTGPVKHGDLDPLHGYDSPSSGGYIAFLGQNKVIIDAIVVGGENIGNGGCIYSG
jgi:hypothetical protein